MKSTMQANQLGLALLLRHACRVNGRSRIVSVTADGLRVEQSFADLALRAGRLAHALDQRGFPTGTVVGTLAGASREHLEAYLGVPASGRILHTINVRLHADQQAYIAEHANDEVIMLDSQNLETFASFAHRLPKLRLVVTVGRRTASPAPLMPCETIDYETLIAEGAPRIDWPDIDENEAAIICFTGGTTGLPKGVAYSHRSIWLQAMSICTANSVGLSSNDCLLPAVPLYHVNGWGLPFAALMAGCDLILPGASMQPSALIALIEAESPTIAAGVPTIWSDVLAEMRMRGMGGLGRLKSVSCGGAQVPQRLVDDYAALGIRMVQAWGMTETSSMSAIAQTPAWASSADDRRRCASAQGRVVCGLEVRVSDLDGATLPADGVAVGEIQIRGPWVTQSYLDVEDRNHLQDGWLRTGDLGTVDADGFICLTDRLKDAIKSGGEWIPSLALENAIRTHPSVLDAAVIAVADERWQERPAAIVVLKPDETANASELRAHLLGRVAKWWIPERWAFTDAIPRTSVGKIDKKRIRQIAGASMAWTLDSSAACAAR
ncbi:long-chain-fatty-acid--CoA ligase [Caballeronia calidae]|uniref:Long-chain-fatty-acid--CoA ligase n=1 Tax=Caballeronia calidae TaxID=1777139 RepID=A0A158CLK4_9BURK|nr:long-chain fatty acid--CoA ligase [Caballeronia calidae]SAK83171.1 long-chain-fatty-acid--CoA ligase [Caballeronia calidae]